MSEEIQIGHHVTWMADNGVTRTGVVLAIAPAGDPVKRPKGVANTRVRYRPEASLHVRALVETAGEKWGVYGPRLSSLTVVRAAAEAA